MRIVITLMIIAISLLLVGCKVGPTSTLQSGFSGTDCNNARHDLALQQPKLESARNRFVEAYKHYLNTFEVEPEGNPEDVTKNPDCSRFLVNPGEEDAASVSGDLNQQCVEYKKLRKLVNERQAIVNSDLCQQGKDSNVQSVFTSYCDSPCAFSNVECGYVELSTSGRTYKFACGTRESAIDAAQGYCREFQVPQNQCLISESQLVRGADLATAPVTLPGAKSDTTGLAIGAFAGVEGEVKITGGAVVEGKASSRFTVEGQVLLIKENGQRQTTIGGYIEAGTTTKCAIEVSGVSNTSAEAFLGVGGAAKFMGNGIEAQAGVRGGVSLKLGQAIRDELGVVEASGGVSADIVLQRCIPLAKRWLQTRLRGVFAPYASQISKHLEKLQDAKKATEDAAAEKERSSARDAGKDAGKSVYLSLNTWSTYGSCVGSTWSGWEKKVSLEGQDACREKADASNHPFSEFYAGCKEQIIYCCVTDSTPCRQ